METRSSRTGVHGVQRCRTSRVFVEPNIVFLVSFHEEMYSLGLAVEISLPALQWLQPMGGGAI